MNGGRARMTRTDPDFDIDLLQGLSAFVDQEVISLEKQHRDHLEDPTWAYDQSGAYSEQLQSLMRTVRMKSAAAGYYSALCPTEIGGGGLGPVANVTMWEFIFHRYGPGRILPYQALAHWATGPSFLLTEITPSLRDQVLDRIMTGEATTCFAMSEPEAGSDAWSMSTRAVRDGDFFVLNGTKQWITNSPYAAFATVFAVTDEDLRRERKGGISCFLVPTDAVGFSVDSVIKMFGQPGGTEAIISFRDVRVPADSVIGTLHRGFDLALGGVSLGRMYNAGRCIGLARWALEQATAYAKERRSFGRPIADYQGVSFMLADSAMDVYATKSMALDCARRLEQGKLPLRDMAIVKAYSTEMCFRVYDRCMQVLGGMGLANETRLYDGWHQARAVRIADGSSEIMRRNVASYLLKGETQF
jgi:acyl-CoA dehydrogenase